MGEWGPRTPFFVAAILAAANGILCFFVLKESLNKKNRREFMWYRANPIGAILDLRKFEGIYPLLLVFLLLALELQSILQFGLFLRWNASNGLPA